MNKKAFITILIADGHHIQRRGMRAMIDEQTDMEVVGETGDGQATIKMINELKPDIVLMDSVLPGCSEEKCAKLIASAKQSKILMLSNLPNINCALRMFELGASGYLLKNCEPDKVVAAIRTVCCGEVYLSNKLLRQLPGGCSLRRLSKLRCRPEWLSPRESEIVSLIAMEHSSHEIVQTLGIQLTTLRTYRKRIREKLSVNSDVELTKFAIRNGLASLY